MLIFEAWDMIATTVEYSIEELELIDNGFEANKLREAYKKADGLMEMLMLKIDSMEDEITITRDEISEVLDDGK